MAVGLGRWRRARRDPGGEVGRGIGAAGFDYDELARRLLVQVVRRLAAAEPEASHPDRRAGSVTRSRPRIGRPRIGWTRIG